MRYARVSLIDGKVYAYDTQSLCRSELIAFSQNFNTKQEVEPEHIADDIIVVTTDYRTIDIVINGSKYTLNFEDSVKINSVKVIYDPNYIYLYSCYKDNNMILFEFRYGFNGRTLSILIFDISCNKWFLTDVKMKVYNELRNIRPIPCDFKKYKKILRRNILLGT